MRWNCVLVIPNISVNRAPNQPPKTPPRFAMDVNMLNSVPSTVLGHIAAIKVMSGNCATVLTAVTRAESVTIKTRSGMPMSRFTLVYSNTAMIVKNAPATVATAKKS